MSEIENLKIGNGGTLHIVGNEDIIANEWEAGQVYIENRSYVIREHKLLMCNTTHTSVEPFDPDKWTEKNIGEALGTAGSANMIECTLAEYNAWKAGGQLINETVYVITDAPNLNATAQDISYDGGADTVWNKIEGIKTALSDLPTEIRCGGGNYSGLKGGGHANRVTVPITFSSPMSGTQYAVFIVVSDAYSDYPYIQGYCFGGSRTANGFTATILSMSSDTTTEVSGSFYWVAVRYK